MMAADLPAAGEGGQGAAVPAPPEDPDPRAYAIFSSGLTKRYGDLLAVDGLDLRVPTGVVAGFVGPNGAGKSKTIRALLGLIRPTAGTAHVLGQPIAHPERYLARTGAMIEGPAFTPSLTGRRSLRALSVLGGHDPSHLQPTLELVGLAERADEPVRSYSSGMKQRLGIAAALLGDPALLVLDEPTNALDPAGIREVRRLLRDVADRGITVFVSSHLLSEIEECCDWLVMIQRGTLRFQGPLREALAAQRPHLIVAAEHDAEAMPELVRIAAEHGYEADPRPDGQLVVEAPLEFAAVLNREAARRGITLVELHREIPDLEETFRMLGEEEPR